MQINVVHLTRDQLLEGWKMNINGLVIRREYEVIREPTYDDGLYLCVAPNIADEILPDGTIRP